MSEFKPRLTAPIKSDKNFYSNINRYYKNGFGLPNCTALVEGCVLENGGDVNKIAYGNAENCFPNTTGYAKGFEPKLGGIMCWRRGQAGNAADGAGHVAYVVKETETTFVTANSAYKGTLFYLKEFKKGEYNFLGNSGEYVYQGCIYALPEELVKEEEKPVAEPVSSKLKHTVVRGDTLHTIAAKYNSGVDLIVRENKMKYPKMTRNYIVTGWVLDIPQLYKVKRGDTLYKIAVAYHTTVDRIYQDNKQVIGVDPNKIYPGQGLVIR